MATKEERPNAVPTYPELVAQKLLKNGFTDMSGELNSAAGRLYYLRETVTEAWVLPTTHHHYVSLSYVDEVTETTLADISNVSCETIVTHLAGEKKRLHTVFYYPVLVTASEVSERSAALETCQITELSQGELLKHVYQHPLWQWNETDDEYPIYVYPSVYNLKTGTSHEPPMKMKAVGLQFRMRRFYRSQLSPETIKGEQEEPAPPDASESDRSSNTPTTSPTTTAASPSSPVQSTLDMIETPHATPSVPASSERQRTPNVTAAATDSMRTEIRQSKSRSPEEMQAYLTELRADIAAIDEQRRQTETANDSANN